MGNESEGAVASHRRGRIDELNDACFIVRDANGQQLAYVYYSNDPDRRATAKVLTKDEARRIAAARIGCVVAPPRPRAAPLGPLQLHRYHRKRGTGVGLRRRNLC